MAGNSTKAASKAWWYQKISAIGLFPLAIWFLVSMAMLAGADYGAIILWVQNPIVTVFLILFAALIFFHLKR